MKTAIKRILPATAVTRIKQAYKRFHVSEIDRELFKIRKQASRMKSGDLVESHGYKIRINDPQNYITLFSDIFVRRIYHFDSPHRTPLILDCGSNIGVSILYFKKFYPDARVIGFEPDPEIFPLLQENIEMNHLKNVELVQAAISGREGMLNFCGDGKYGSYLADLQTGSPPDGWKLHQVRCTRLKNVLTESVDFLKLNVEGAECEALLDCGDSLRLIKEMVIEYHHLPGLQRNLHTILALLHDLGFEYVINDFDSETNPGVQTPFKLMPETSYFLLLYAKQWS